MSIRLPIKEALFVNHTNQGDSSTAGGWAYPFTLPQDTDNVVVKVLPSVTAGGVSVIFQTSDDGGTTYYDVARTSIASNSGTTGTAGMSAQWLTIPVIGGRPRTVQTASLIAAGSLLTAVFNGGAAASTLASGESSGLPIMGIQNRLFFISTGNATSIATTAAVRVNNQSSRD